MASVKRLRKFAGGYVTPSIAVVLLLWSDGRQRVPLAFEYHRDLRVCRNWVSGCSTEESVQTHAPSRAL